MATEVWSGAGAAQSEAEKIAAVRAELPATAKYAYLNAGTNGPLPRSSADVLVEETRRELEDGRIGPQYYPRMVDTLNTARATVARLLGCDPLEVALTHNTTEGINIALMGMDWRPGDEVITSATEHAGVLYPLYLLHQRYGVRIRMTEIGAPGRDARHTLEELRAALTPRTRAVVLSHVCWTSGMVLPVREIADLAHAQGALVICDAAQAGGMIDPSVYDLGVDAYACSGQKWLCGPDGTGALFVRQDRLGDIHQTYMGYKGVRPGMSDAEGNFVPQIGAKRYESCTLHLPSVMAFQASLCWLLDDLGMDWVYARIAELGHRCYDDLARVDGVTLHTPRDAMAGLVHFSVEGIPAEDVSAKLGDAGFRVRHTPHPPAVRVSTGFYNTEEEIEGLVAAVRNLVAGDRS